MPVQCIAGAAETTPTFKCNQPSKSAWNRILRAYILHLINLSYLNWIIIYILVWMLFSFINDIKNLKQIWFTICSCKINRTRTLYFIFFLIFSSFTIVIYEPDLVHFALFDNSCVSCLNFLHFIPLLSNIIHNFLLSNFQLRFYLFSHRHHWSSISIWSPLFLLLRFHFTCLMILTFYWL